MAKDKAQAAPASHDEVDLDELLDVSRSRKVYLLILCIFLLCTAHSILSYCGCQIHGTFHQDPELEKLHAERIAALKVLAPSFTYEAYVSVMFFLFLKSSMQQKEAEKREVLKRQGHGEYREITEGDFLGEVTGSEKVICHFYHREFYRCKYAIACLSCFLRYCFVVGTYEHCFL